MPKAALLFTNLCDGSPLAASELRSRFLSPPEVARVGALQIESCSPLLRPTAPEGGGSFTLQRGQPDMPPAVHQLRPRRQSSKGPSRCIGAELLSRRDPCGPSTARRGGARPGDCMLLIKKCAAGAVGGAVVPRRRGGEPSPNGPNPLPLALSDPPGQEVILGEIRGGPSGGGGGVGAPRWMLAGMVASSPASTAKQTLAGGCVGRIIMVDERRGRGAVVGGWRGEVG